MRLLLIAVLLITIGCADKYETKDISGITIKIDKTINQELQDDIWGQLELDLSKDGLLDSTNLLELKFDSTFFSYLLSVKSKDSLRRHDLELLKGFGTIISKDFMNNAPIHYYSEFNKQYYKHDTTTIIFLDHYHLEDKKFNLSSKGMSIDQLDLISRLIYVYTRDIKFKEKLVADIKVDSTLYSIDFILNKDIENVDKIRESFAKLDPADLYLTIGNNALLIKFRDSLKTEIRNAMYFK